MIKTKVIVFSLSAIATTGVVEVGEHAPPNREVLAIPYKSVGEFVPLQRYPYAPVTECRGISFESDIDLLSTCAAKRVGWLKL
jgi:hypothetical protein